MKKTAFVIALLFLCVVTSTAQKPSLELTFTAIDSATHIQLDSIKVMNRSQGGDTVLYYPDTVLVLDYITGVDEVNSNGDGLRIYQNYPNPVIESTTISIYVPEKGLVRCMINDIMGRVVHQYEEVLESGVHSFSYSPGGGEMSFFTAQWKDSRETIKILQSNITKSGSLSLSYIGMDDAPEYEIKAFAAKEGFPFELGDKLYYIGYVDTLEGGLIDVPEISKIYTFQFAYNIPCPGMPTITYEGQVYHTVQIFSQCWLKENLNVGTMIPGLEEMSDNGIIEKYCYNDVEDSCVKYGGLYQWNEMMLYKQYPNISGICPPDWHIPTDEEWKFLEGMVDSQYGVGEIVWDSLHCRGFDAGNNLKEKEAIVPSGWTPNKFGFSMLLCGERSLKGSFVRIHNSSETYTSTRGPDGYSLNAYFRSMYKILGCSERMYSSKQYGKSVRCIKD